MAVDNVRVRGIIDDEIKKASLTGATGGEAIRQAWVELKKWRDQAPAPGATANSLDLDKAAAENYMYARWAVGTGFVSRFQMNSIAVAYYASKRLGWRMPTSGNPQSEPDTGVLGWGGIGSEEGEADRQLWNPNVNPPLWRPVNDIFPFLTGTYAHSLGRPGTAYK